MSTHHTAARETPAVIDRVEGNIAVLLVGPNQQVVDVPRAALPAGTQAGQWLRLMWDGGGGHADRD